MTQRILSISGLRGIVGDGLDPLFLTRYAAALGTLINGGKVVLSRDDRGSGLMVKQAVMAGFMATGCEVIDADIATTPTCGVLVTGMNADAGLQITASHNPIEWNGLKPFNREGAVFNHEQGAALLDILEQESFAFVDQSGLGSITLLPDPAKLHQERVFQLIDSEAIGQKAFKVVLDCNHGSGAVATPKFLEELGCEVTVLGGTPDGQFDHTPEPLEQNLQGLCQAVCEHQADIGFAQDPDADRLAIVDETGSYIGEELTLGLAVDYVLPHRPGSVVVNGSTSRLTADLCEQYGCDFHRSYVGEANVVAMMKEVQAEIGGEGNGGVIEPRVGYVRDSFVSMAYVLAGLTEKEITLSEWVAKLPAYQIVKSKVECPRDQVDLACNALQKAYPDAEVSEGDGLRLDWSDRWVQVRASNTEPILRVIAEAPETAVAQELCDQSLELVKQAVS